MALVEFFTLFYFATFFFFLFFQSMVGGMLSGFSFTGAGHIPINKNLFSLSFVLLTGGLAYVVFSILYYIIDHKNWWSGFPFNYTGKN